VSASKKEFFEMRVKIRKKEDGPSAIFSASAERGPLGLTVVINAQDRDFEIQSMGTTWLFPEYARAEHFAILITSDGHAAEAILVAETPEDVDDLRRSIFDQRVKEQLVLAFVKDDLLLNGEQLGHCFAESADKAPALPEGFDSFIKKAAPDSVAEVMIDAFGQAMVETGEDQILMECHHPMHGEFEIVVRRKNFEKNDQKSIANPRFGG
jgi:hypothetical protein